MSKSKDLTRIRAHQLQLGDTFIRLDLTNDVHVITVGYLCWEDDHRIILVSDSLRGFKSALFWDEHVYVVPQKTVDKLNDKKFD